MRKHSTRERVYPWLFYPRDVELHQAVIAEFDATALCSIF